MPLFSSIHLVDGIPCVQLRPDSVEILEDEEANEHFTRYFMILRRKTPPKFRLAQTIPTSYDPKGQEKDLWKEHRTKMQKMKQLMKKKAKDELLTYVQQKPRYTQNLLTLKKDLAFRILKECRYCERHCGVYRTTGERGFCGLGDSPQISSIFTHTGEEAELVPSLTIFFYSCTFKCVYCQNYRISQEQKGESISSENIVGGITSKWKNRRIRNVIG